MNKLEIINKIRNKIIGDIKNKSWFKNYKYKKMDETHPVDYFMFMMPYLFISGPLLIDGLMEAPTVGKIEFLSMIIAMFFSCFGMGVLTCSIFNKYNNKKNKEEINSFIEKSENEKDAIVMNLLVGNEGSDNMKKFANFIKSQPLEKEDIDMFKKALINNFSKEELNHIFYNEKLNNMIKNKGGIDYNYVIYAFNLLEEKLKNENSKMDINTIKNNLFKEEKLNNNLLIKSNVEKVVSI